MTIKNDAIVLDLSEHKPYVVEMLPNINMFRYPLYFATSGFVFSTPTQTMQINNDSSLGFKRPFLNSGSKGVYGPFAEIDLF